MYKLATIPLLACGVLYSAGSAGAAPAAGENGKRRDAPGLSTGSVQPGKTDAERMRECMAIWDSGTRDQAAMATQLPDAAALSVGMAMSNRLPMIRRFTTLLSLVAWVVLPVRRRCKCR